MTPSPSPLPTVILQQAPAQAWQVWAAFAPLIAAFIVGGVALAALLQKYRSDNRAEWWRRSEWALDAATSGDEERQYAGLAVLEILGQSKLAGPEEFKIIEAAWHERLLDEPPPDLDQPEALGENGSDEGEEVES